MEQLNVNFSQVVGKVKPMHSVNNGPVYSENKDQTEYNLIPYREAGIPYARTHDASINYRYGGEHTVDVGNIFPDFDADPEDPNAYDFTLTDEYLRCIRLAGTKVYYRLGNKIEHWIKKYGTLEPKDHKKWAVICEHIIRHYTEGWADGYHWDIEYWEIWNEPDLDPDDSIHKRCWGGTKASFFAFYDTAAKHLKSCFPHLKIGGPALAWNWEWAEDFLKQLTAPLDFFSWHCYATDPAWIKNRTNYARELLDKYGYTQTESILNEWNYVRGWGGADWTYSLQQEKGIKGAAFTASVMLDCQYGPMNNLMYYDARPCGMNGLFNTDCPSLVLKGYYPFRMFNTLYKLGSAVAVTGDNTDLHIAAAKGEQGQAIMLSHFNDDDSAQGKPVKLHVEGLENPGGVKFEFYMLDANHDEELVKTEYFTAETLDVMVQMPLFSVCLIKILPLDEA